MRAVCIMWLLFIIAWPARAQQLFFNHLTVNNGLTQGVNNCIFRDSEGYVWISSYDGLNRFDGIQCQKFYASSVRDAGLRGTLFLNILEDRNKDLWIGSNEGLNHYSRAAGSFQCYKPVQGNTNDAFCSPFHIDPSGHVWLQSGNGIFIFNPSLRSFRKISSIGQGVNIQVKAWPAKLFSQVQQLWVLSGPDGKLQVGSVQHEQVEWKVAALPTEISPVNGISLSGNTCWLLTQSGLYAADVSRPSIYFTRVPRTTGLQLTTLHRDTAGSLWLGTLDAGIFRTDTAGSFLEHYPPKPDDAGSLSGNRVVYITTDQSRNLWVSVWGKGVDYTNPDRFHFNRYFSKDAALAAGTDYFIRAVVETGDEIWCATQSGGIVVMDTLRRVKQVIRQGLPASLEHLYVQGRTVWVASLAGLFAVDAGTKKVRAIPMPASIDLQSGAGQLNYICGLPGGRLLLSSNAGIWLVSPSAGTLAFTRLRGVSPGDVYLTTAYAGNGRVYLSKAFKGFGRYRLEGDSLVTETDIPLHASVKCFTQIHDSLVWIGSTIGLIRFNPAARVIERLYTTEDGLLNHYIYAALPSGDDLWLSTNAGIVRFNTKRNTFKTYTTADGLLSNEFNTYAYCRSRSGELLFGGVNGLNGCNPLQQERISTIPSLVLSSLRVDDSLLVPGQWPLAASALQLPFNRSTVELQFTVIDFANAGAAYILYFMEGYDKTWVQASNQSVVRYVKLPPGKYRLQVKGFNADGIACTTSFNLPVEVLPPWWQQWWFYLLLAAGLALIVFFSIRAFLRKKLLNQRMLLEKELAVEQERIRMARELHDGLGSMLSGIKHSLNAIGNEASLTAEQHHKFDYTVDKLDESIKDLRAVSHGMFSAELLEQGLEAALSNYCAATSATTGLPVTLECIGLEKVVIPGETAFHFFRMVQELLQNVVRHAEASAAIVQVSYQNKIVSLTVEDNGCGFEWTEHRSFSGIGLKNVESRVKSMKGKIDIQSKPGKGTSVLVEVPVG